MIRVSNFKKAYERDVAIQDLSFSLESGQIMGLIGPNGAGKTTTLRAMTGIIPASGGDLKIDGFHVDHSPIDVKRITCYVPDDPQLFNDLTVEQHFSFTAGVYGIADWRPMMVDWLERFALDEKINTRASDLSRGMRQKLAICCAYLCRPKALLLDEPMTGLDPLGIRVLKNSIVEQANRGAAVIISSHLLAMVEDICTHVLILERGERMFHGTLDEMRTEFANNNQNSLEEIFFEAVESQKRTLPKLDMPTLNSNPTIV